MAKFPSRISSEEAKFIERQREDANAHAVGRDRGGLPSGADQENSFRRSWALARGVGVTSEWPYTRYNCYFRVSASNRSASPSPTPPKSASPCPPPHFHPHTAPCI